MLHVDVDAISNFGYWKHLIAGSSKVYAIFCVCVRVCVCVLYHSRTTQKLYSFFATWNQACEPHKQQIQIISLRKNFHLTVFA